MDSAQASSIISHYGASSSSSSMSSSSASGGYDPKQVEVNLDSGMMTGDPHAHDDDSSTSTDKAEASTAVKDDTAASTAAAATLDGADAEADKIMKTSNDASTASSTAGRSDDVFAKARDDDYSNAAKQPAKADTWTDSPKPVQADSSDSSSDALWEPKKLAATSFDSRVQELKEQEDGTDLIKEFSSKYRDD